MHRTHVSHARRLALLPLVAAATLSIWGCGGGGGGGGNTPGVIPTPDPGGSEVTGDSSSARFHVDVTSGTVTALPSSGTVGTSAVLTGTAVGFRTTRLVDEDGSVGIKATEVRIENHTGRDLTNAKVVFSDITNLMTTPDIRVSSMSASLAQPAARDGMAVGLDGCVLRR